MIKSKGLVTNIEIETIRRTIDNDGRDEPNEGTMQESDNTAGNYEEDVDINHADTVNENDLSNSERERLLRLREALGGDDLVKQK